MATLIKREDGYSVALTIDGLDFGVWDALDGGGIDSEETRYKPGGLAAEVALGGTRTRSNITLRKLYDEGIHASYHWLDERAGRAAVVVTRQPLDTDGNAYGRPLIYKALLKAVTPPTVDSTSSDAGLIEIEVTPSATLS